MPEDVQPPEEPENPTPPNPFTTEGAQDNTKEPEDPRQGLPASVEVVTASGQYPLDATKQSDPKGRYVQYNGVGTVREMTPADWKAAQVDSDNTYQWSYMNHKRLPLSHFSDEELQYLLRVDGRFSLVEDKGDEKASETTE